MATYQQEVGPTPWLVGVGAADEQTVFVADPLEDFDVILALLVGFALHPAEARVVIASGPLDSLLSVGHRYLAGWFGLLVSVMVIIY